MHWHVFAPRCPATCRSRSGDGVPSAPAQVPSPRSGTAAGWRFSARDLTLPDGKVVVMGGQTYMKGFQDSDSVFPTEIWDPATRSFSISDSISVTKSSPAVCPRS